MNRINVIALGVRNMEKSIRFYRDGLGFQTDEKEDNPKVIFFNTAGTKFELYPLELLAQDISETNPPEIENGFGGITLAYNVKTEQEVHEIIELARKSGATIVKEPQKVFWGGYHAYFADPDDYYWEVAYNPYWSFDEKDMVVLQSEED
jgi:catechol 2,3-dioxygenase-like lactoylglutathione lyase family enzyme